MFRALVGLVFICLSTLTLSAQERPSAILVLDASGSMWGQIEGVNKIVIARDVVTDLLETLPADQALGLVAYGHRTKGDCNDIELLATPGADRADIAAAVAGLNPKGKTPLSAAVIQAAEALKYTEEAATVILVSDGIETCDFDPCDVGRQLEATGVNFTAHVIGFDVADAEARAQLQCLAEETGGTFLSAANAGELADALTQVAAAPMPDPEPTTLPVSFRATDGEGGPVINEGLVWTITSGSDTLAEGADDATPTFDVTEGQGGLATVIRLIDEEVGQVAYTATGAAQEVIIALPKYAPAASVSAPASAPAGSLVAVTWSGPKSTGDYLSSASEGKEDGYYDAYVNVDEATQADGTLLLRMPPVAGPAEIRYVLGKGAQTLARTTIDVTPLTFSLTPPTGATIGKAEQIAWTGPDYPRDYIAVSALDDGDGAYKTYAYTEDGAPLTLQMPNEPGTYELRYVLNASHSVAARSVPFEVGEATVNVTGPTQAAAGSEISVTWQGPNANRDYIAIAEVGAADGVYKTYSYTEGGSPLTVKTPIEPGNYEIRYVLAQGSKTLAAAPITLTEVVATLTAPEAVMGGAAVSVAWTGPAYDRDYIAFAPAGSEDGKYLTYTYVQDGNPLTVSAPTEAGDYELRYMVRDGSSVLGRTPIRIDAATATIDAPATALAGSPLSITWAGPATGRDYLSVAMAGDDAGKYVTYEYTEGGTPLIMTMPSVPGSYELRYIQSGNPVQILTSKVIEVTDVTASLTVERLNNGVKVTWQGPDYARDYIALAEQGAAPGQYLNYTYTKQGPSMIFELPETPGTYELRYILEGTTTRILDSVPFTVE